MDRPIAGLVTPGSSRIPTDAAGLDEAARKTLPEFCRVTVVSRPSSKSHIHIEVWLPVKDWNGRLLGTGNGGFAGRIAYRPLVAGLLSHYAVANTDLGTSPAENFFPSPAQTNDWANRSVHEMTVAAEQLAKVFYGRAPLRKYFSGCSSGGQEGLTEAQRYPKDYDGILVGAPAHDRVDLHVAILWNWLAMHRADGSVIVQPLQLTQLAAAVSRACPSVKGVVMDPAQCHFDVKSLQCSPAGLPQGCLTHEQTEAIEKIYGGPKNPDTRQSIYPGLAYGGETQWNALLRPDKADGAMPYEALFQSALGPKLRGPADFRFGADVQSVERMLSPVVNATNPNLDAFRAHGGKIVMTHGWADPIIAPQGTIGYVEEVRKRYGASVDGVLRSYLVPGEAHCGGGPGPSAFDGVGVLTDWVEAGKIPGAIRVTEGQDLKETLICPYPKKPSLHTGALPELASSYICAE